MKIRNTILAAAALLLGSIGAASAGDSTRVLGETDLDQVKAGISFGFQIGTTRVFVFGLANPTNVQPQVFSDTVSTNTPFAFSIIDFGFSLPQPTTSSAFGR